MMSINWWKKFYFVVVEKLQSFESRFQRTHFELIFNKKTAGAQARFRCWYCLLCQCQKTSRYPKIFPIVLCECQFQKLFLFQIDSLTEAAVYSSIKVCFKCCCCLMFHMDNQCKREPTHPPEVPGVPGGLWEVPGVPGGNLTEVLVGVPGVSARFLFPFVKLPPFSVEAWTFKQTKSIEFANV